MNRETGDKRSPLSEEFSVVLIGIPVFFGLFMISRSNYLLFHCLVEVFSIAIACGIFMLAWNSRRLHRNGFFLLIGIAYIFVGGIDLLHTLAYEGMGVYGGYGADLATRLWITARYLEGFSLLIAPLLLNRRIRYNLVFVSYTIAAAVLLMSIFSWDIFPRCYIDGIGLTAFKKSSEYIISAVLLLSIFLLYIRRMHLDSAVFKLFVASIVITICAELSFTMYVSVYGFANFLGHIFKISSFYLIYRAVIVIGLTKPYGILFRNLKQQEETARRERDLAINLIDNAQSIVLVLDTKGRIVRFNPYMEELTGYPCRLVRGKSWFTTFLPERERERTRALFSTAIGGENTRGTINPIVARDGSEHLIQWYDSTLKDSDGNVTGLLAIGQEVPPKGQVDDTYERHARGFAESSEKVSELEGFLPICASCKKIQSDEGLWVEIEAYFRERTKVRFTHGICPECMQKLYPNFGTGKK